MSRNIGHSEGCRNPKCRGNCEIQRPVDRVVIPGQIYCVSDETVTEYEAGNVRFVDKDSVVLRPIYVGRGGNTFHTKFVKA